MNFNIYLTLTLLCLIPIINAQKAKPTSAGKGKPTPAPTSAPDDAGNPVDDAGNPGDDAGNSEPIKGLKPIPRAGDKGKAAPTAAPEEFGNAGDYAGKAGNDLGDLESTPSALNKNKSPKIDDRRRAAELQAKIEAIHKNDPRDPMQLAQRVLSKAFKNYNKNSKGLKVTMLLKSFSSTPVKNLMFVIRLLEYMDTNTDYIINEDEFTGFFTAPTAHPDKLIDLMFKIQDYDGNGVICQYESLTNEILSLGVNYNLHDMWQSVTQKMSDMDVDDDGVVNPSEFANHVLFQISKAIVQQREDMKDAANMV